MACIALPNPLDTPARGWRGRTPCQPGQVRKEAAAAFSVRVAVQSLTFNYPEFITAACAQTLRRKAAKIIEQRSPTLPQFDMHIRTGLRIAGHAAQELVGIGQIGHEIVPRPADPARPRRAHGIGIKPEVTIGPCRAARNSIQVRATAPAARQNRPVRRGDGMACPAIRPHTFARLHSRRDHGQSHGQHDIPNTLSHHAPFRSLLVHTIASPLVDTRTRARQPWLQTRARDPRVRASGDTRCAARPNIAGKPPAPLPTPPPVPTQGTRPMHRSCHSAPRQSDRRPD